MLSGWMSGVVSRRPSVDHRRRQSGDPARRSRDAPAGPARALPHQRGLALILMPIPARSRGAIPARESAKRHVSRTVRQIFGIVLHPAGAGEVLRKFLLPDASDVELSIEHDRSRRGRALVNGENVGAHIVWSLLPHVSAVAYFHANGRLAGSLFWLMVTADAQERHARSSSHRGGQDHRRKRYAEAEVLVDRILATAPRHAGATTQGAVGPAARGH